MDEDYLKRITERRAALHGSEWGSFSTNGSGTNGSNGNTHGRAGFAENILIRKKIKKQTLIAKDAFDAARLMELAQKRKEDEWDFAGQAMALKLFHAAAERVPAYRHFLKVNGVRPETIKTIKDFRMLPTIDKKNYFRNYPIQAMCWDGVMHKGATISHSSGSSGLPLYWPRYALQEHETSILHEIIFKEVFEAEKFSTLAIISFSMGVYIAGIITANSVRYLGDKGYPITTVTPGIDIGAIIRTVKEFGASFGQIVLLGYPPFVKDVLDEGRDAGIDWKKIRVKFLFATESFSEQWRDYVHSFVGAEEPLTTSINIYGSAEAAILGHETPLSILIRREAWRDPGIEYALYGIIGRSPTLVHYYPTLRYFENVNKELVFTAHAGMPLVRYNIHDVGDIIYPSRADYVLGVRGINMRDLLASAGCAHFEWNLPMVYVMGRSDFAVSLYGLKIYPEHVRRAIETPQILDICTGKFKMSVLNRENYDQEFNIAMELKDGIDPKSFEAQTASNILPKQLYMVLKEVNLEYNALTGSIGERAMPKVTFKKFQDPEYFAPGIKHRWSGP